MCKRGEDLARRSVHIDGGIKADWSGVELIQVDGFAGEHTNSPCLRGQGIYGPRRRSTSD
jgi:hypothetical protein